MAKKNSASSSNGASPNRVSSFIDELLLAVLERSDDSFEIGRYLVTFKEEAIGY